MPATLPMAVFRFALVLLLAAHAAAAHPQPPLPAAAPPPGLLAGNGTADSRPALRVIGGSPVEWAAAAGMHAKLTINGDTHFICGGSLITSRHVLTAAHCVTAAPSAYHVRLGGMDVDHGLVRAVAAIAIHPEYAVGRPSHADVAVLTLDREVSKTEAKQHHLRMVTLNPDAARPKPGSTAVMSGWGHSSESGGPTVDQLLRVRLRVLSHAECLRIHTGGRVSRYASAAATPPQPVDEAEELCTGGDGRRSCTGDSGGPVWSYESGHFVQWGIISHALGTTALPCDGQYPTMLMRTSYYKRWVETIVGKLH